DVRGDIYGLGLVLHELIARRPAFPRRRRAQLIHDIERLELPLLRSLDPAVPEDLERIVAKATAKLPEERYADAEALQSDLAAFLAGKPIQARPLGLAYMLRLLVRRHRAAAAVAATALLTATVLGIGYVMQLRGLLAEITASKQEAERRGALASQQFARTQLEAGELGATQEILRSIPEAERGWGWWHLHDRSGLPAEPTFIRNRYPQEGRALPTGNLVIWGDQEVQVVRPGTYRRVTSLGRALNNGTALVHGEFTGATAADASGALLVAQSEPDELAYWEGVQRAGLESVEGFHEEPRFLRSSLEAGVAAFAVRNAIHLVALPRGAPIAVHDLSKGMIPSAVEVLSSGEVLVGTENGEVLRVNVQDGTESILQRHRGPVTALLADGDELVGSGSELGDVRLMGRAIAAGLRPLSPVGHGVRFLRVQDEHTILAGLQSGQLAHIDRRLGSVRHTEPLFISPCVAVFEAPPKEPGEPVRWEALSAWGRRQYLRRSTRPGLITAAGAGTPAWKPGFSSTGEQAAFVSHDGFLNLVGQAFQRVPCEARQAECHFTRDDRLIAAAGLVVEAATGEEVLRWVPPYGECIESRWLGDTLAMLVWSPFPELLEEEFRLDLFLWDASSPDEAPAFASTVMETIPWYRTPRVVALQDEASLVLGNSAGILLRYHVHERREVWRSNAHGGEVQACQVDEEKGIIYSFGGPTMLHRSSLATGEELKSDDTQLDALSRLGPRIFRLAISSEANLIAILTTKNVIQVFDQRDGAEILRHDASFHEPAALRFMPGGQWLAVSCANGDIQLIGHGEPPAWAASAVGFVDPIERLEFGLSLMDPERLKGRAPTPLELRTAFSIASFAKPTTLDDRVPRLRESLLPYVEPGAFERAWFARAHPEHDRFGRFGWAPRSFYGE
ncbi:MAG: hypothetical protein AAGG01_16470, partial [Planctomycetota bacterium]